MRSYNTYKFYTGAHDFQSLTIHLTNTTIPKPTLVILGENAGLFRFFVCVHLTSGDFDFPQSCIYPFNGYKCGKKPSLIEMYL